MKTSLFVLVNEEARIIEEEADRLEAEGLSYEEAIVQAIEKADKLTKDKALAYGGLIRDLEAQADAISEAAKRQQARAKAKENAAGRLRKRLLELLPADFKAENEQISLKFVRRGFKVNDSGVMDISKLPIELLKTVPATVVLDKDAAEKQLKQLLAIAQEAQEKGDYAGPVNIMGLKLEEVWTVQIR